MWSEIKKIGQLFGSFYWKIVIAKPIYTIISQPNSYADNTVVAIIYVHHQNNYRTMDGGMIN